MPSKSPIVVPKVLGRRSRGSAPRVARRRRPGPQPWPTSAIPIPLTSTRERDMADWVGWFGRFHAEPTGLYVPYGLCTVDCRVEVDDQPALTHRCVREVAKFNGARGVEWRLITWVPGLPGVQMQSCASLEEATMALQAPAQTVRFASQIAE